MNSVEVDSECKGEHDVMKAFEELYGNGKVFSLSLSLFVWVGVALGRLCEGLYLCSLTPHSYASLVRIS